MAHFLLQLDFVKALKMLERPGGQQTQFLRLHAQAKGLASTMRRLAQQVGYASCKGMNLQYGLLARKIASSAGLHKPDITTLVEFVVPKGRSAKNISNHKWILVMREPFAEELQAVGWI